MHPSSIAMGLIRKPRTFLATLSRASIYIGFTKYTSTYDHTQWRTRDPVRSPIDKPLRGRLVVGSVTTSEHRLLHVFFSFFFWDISCWWAFFFGGAWTGGGGVNSGQSCQNLFNKKDKCVAQYIYYC